jgi:hypothetical protein
MPQHVNVDREAKQLLAIAQAPPLPTPAQAFEEVRKIVDNKIEGPKKLKVPPSVMPP